jgi:predicted DNA-binding transcriptional regulator AlpA
MHQSQSRTAERIAAQPIKKYRDEFFAAAYTGMSLGKLRRLRLNNHGKKDRNGPKYYKLGNSVRYTQEDLDAWASGCAEAV